MSVKFTGAFAPLPLIFISLLLTLFINIPVSANESDWGLVIRFKKQLTLAEEGDVKAMYNLGKLYERGRGVGKNLSTAVKWYVQAADAGQTYAQSRLGIMYFEGRGVPRNFDKALKLLRAAAKENIPNAQFQLANMYELGTGVEQDINKAIFWYKKADEAGYYLASNKIERLNVILKSGGITSSKKNAKTTSPNKNLSLKVVKNIINGRWFKNNKPVSYLPSAITNCVTDSNKSMYCISTSQERSTGMEIITYNVESNIKIKDNRAFDVEYSNNVLDVDLLSVEDGDGEEIEHSTSRIKEGKQGKKRRISCTFKNASLLSCSKGGSNFELVRK